MQLCFAKPLSRVGGAPRRRSRAAAPVGHAMTRRVRRLRGALRPMTRDARLSALHRGGFGLRGRAALTGICAGSGRAGSRAVPGQAGQAGQAVTSHRRRTPRLAPHSGSSLEHALNEQAGKGSSVASQCSQEKNSFCVRNLAAKRDASHIVTTGNVKIVLCSV